MNQNTSTEAAKSFDVFYRDQFLHEHRVPSNIACHLAGTLASLVLVVAALAGMISLWWLLAYPVVHIGPGLIGHRLFERDAEVGDTRVLRRGFPGHWFIRANHRMALRLLLTGRA